MPGNPYANTGWWNNFVAAAGPQAAQDWVNQQTGGGGGSSDAMRNQLAQQMPQQALSGGTVQYSTPGPASVAQDYQPPGNNSDIPANLLARMSPTDIMLFRQAQKGQAIPTGVAGPYGGGAMGAPQIPSGYNAFSGAGLPATNIGKGGLYGESPGSNFAGGGSGGGGGGGYPSGNVQGPYPMPNVNNPNWLPYDQPQMPGDSFHPYPNNNSYFNQTFESLYNSPGS